MINKWIEGRISAVTPILTIAVLIIVNALFQSIFIECEKNIAKCQPFSASYIFTLNTSNPINEISKSVNGEGQDKVLNRKLIVERYSGRVVWVFMVAVSALLGLASIFAACWLIYKSSSFRNESAATRTTIVMGLSLLSGFLLYVFADRYSPLMKGFLENTIAQEGQFGVPVVFGTMKLINSFSFAAAFTLVFASCAILLPREGVAEIDTRDGDAAANETDQAESKALAGITNRLTVISEQMKDLRIVLYFGTLLLIIGVLRMSAVTQWTLAFIPPNAVEAAKIFNLTLLSVQGGFYSLILAAVYLPAAYILQRRAQLLAKESLLPSDKQEEILISKGLTFSFKKSLPEALAILSPLLAGPIGDLFTKVFPK